MGVVNMCMHAYISLTVKKQFEIAPRQYERKDTPARQLMWLLFPYGSHSGNENVEATPETRKIEN